MAGPRRLVLVSYDFPPIQGPGVWRAMGFVRHLPDLGWSVTVCASDRSHWHNRTDPDLLTLLPGTVKVDRVRGIPFGHHLHRLLPERVVRRLGRMWPDQLLLPALKLARCALREIRDDQAVILTSGPPHIVHLAGLIARRLRRCVWVADYRDPWMDDEVHAGRGRLQRAFGRRLERATMRRADLVTVVTPTWHKTIAARRGNRPTLLLPNASDFDTVPAPAPHRPWSPRERVLLFPGTPQPGNNTMTLWHGIAGYRDALPAGASPVRFAFMGLGAIAHDLSRALGIDDLIEDIGPQPWHRATALIGGADGIIVPVQRTPTSSGVVPAKIYDAMAQGRFILFLGDPEGDAARLLRRYPWTGLADSGDPHAIATAIRHFAEAALPPRDAPRPAPPWTRRTVARDLHRAIESLVAGRTITGGPVWPGGTEAASPPRA